MQWIADLLAALRSAIGRLEWKCRLRLWPSSGPQFAWFIHGDVRVRVFGPYMSCDHQVEIQACAADGEWVSIGFVSEADLPATICLLKAADRYLRRMRPPEQERVGDDWCFADYDRVAVDDVECSRDLVNWE